MKAFPHNYERLIDGDIATCTNTGMDLRDWFAGLAMQAIIGSTEEEFTPEEFDGLAKIFYRIGDAMMKARENKNG